MVDDNNLSMDIDNGGNHVVYGIDEEIDEDVNANSYPMKSQVDCCTTFPNDVLNQSKRCQSALKI